MNMILSFKQKFSNGKLTYFAEKILKKWNYEEIEIDPRLWNDVVLNPDFEQKIHSIREDSKNRWKVGNKIHAAYNNRTNNYFQFAPTFECKGIQKIKITYFPELAWPSVIIDKRNLNFEEIERLSINDGFEEIGDFLEWFNKDFTGKIIHFTDFKY